MIILAIETTTSVESLALVTEGKILAEINLDNGLSHSARLVKNVDYLFKSAGLSISDVSAVAVSSGPGSFTGLRVGFSLAKGLAYAAKKYFLAVPTLDAFAFSVCRLTGGVAGKKIKNGPENVFCPVIDARKNEFYFSAYAENASALVKLREESSLPAEEMLKELKSLKAKKYYFFGDGVIKSGPEIKKALKCPVFLEAFPRASAVGALALLELARGEKQDFNKALPFYLRRPDAVINKEAKDAARAKCRQ